MAYNVNIASKLVKIDVDFEQKETYFCCILLIINSKPIIYE
jgi:hypothetical protein